MGFGAKPAKFYNIFHKFMRVSTVSPQKYSHSILSQKFGGRQQPIGGGGAMAPGCYGSYEPVSRGNSVQGRIPFGASVEKSLLKYFRYLCQIRVFDLLLCSIICGAYINTHRIHRNTFHRSPHFDKFQIFNNIYNNRFNYEYIGSRVLLAKAQKSRNVLQNSAEIEYQ